MPAPTRELVFDPPAPEPEVALVPDSSVGMFERLARDSSVPVEKLEKLIELQERIMRHQAKAEFDGAFAQMQGDIPIITERGEIVVKGELRSRFARLEDILEVVKPVLQKHGFALRFRATAGATPGRIKIIGILSHRSGHSEEDEFEAPADDSGSKNTIQAIGSTRSYGQRYTTISLLNIVTRGADDDGARSEQPPMPPAPDGYKLWLDALTSEADSGTASFASAWNKSKPEFRTHLTKTEPTTLARLRTRAGVK